ncbi:carbamoyltransferase C-terminal domain-containing protein [Pseudonocardia acidicola]|uniref:Carbamoyltransferase n=1 Tax=Pseudonocardia acidicola TaxID=2724939 RepID=A0ABX1SF79_9PSEU|nr:carbamoyltransferase C-terminal domain-containing protein [Pseudonocardia acidicola]NMH99765.1 carbamoyltransferase [Pseudonocardia acidicola]
MRDAPTVIGINRAEGASVCLARGPRTVYSLQKERITRHRHHWGRPGDLTNLYVPRLPALTEPVDLVVECYSSDPESENLETYRDELATVLTFRTGTPVTRLSHHLAHLFSAFPPSPFDAAAVMVIDAQGSRAPDFTEPAGYDATPHMLEVASFYVCERGRVECLGKHLWHGDWREPTGLGCFYALLTRAMFPGEGNEAKVEALAPYGRPGAFGLPGLVVDGNRVLIPDAWLELFAQHDRFTHFCDGTGSFTDCADLAAAGQAAFEAAMLQIADWLHRETGLEDLCFAGGTALNCSANSRLIREGPFHEVFVPPSPHDGGTALGCALYGMIECLGEPSEFRWTDDFLGPPPDERAIKEAVTAAAAGLVASQPADLVSDAVDLLELGRVVGLHQGRSESGPRALGNRSILADPRRPGMQDFINSRVTGREWFHPPASVVPRDAAAGIVDHAGPAPSRLLATGVPEPCRAVLPAITHVDGTARIQTVDPAHSPFLHALLAAFGARTGCPVLLNNPLSEPGDPLAESPEDSLACLQNTSMHALLMPPYLIRKRDEPPIPGRWSATAVRRT